jgi:hypothetical protein
VGAGGKSHDRFFIPAEAHPFRDCRLTEIRARPPENYYIFRVVTL